MPARLVFLALLMVGAFAESAFSVSEDEDPWRAPLANRNQFPPAFLFIALEPERATVLEKGERSLLFNFDYSNILLLQETPTESLKIDLESLRAFLQVKLGLGNDFEVAAGLPIYWMQGGFLDPLISSFHNALNIPNKTRDREPDNLFRYHWRVRGESVLGREESFVALGDLTLQVKRALASEKLGATELAVRAALKIPTGSRDRLVSSGGADFAFGAELSRVGRKVGGYLNFNYNITSDLANARAKNFASFMAAFDWRFKPTLAAVVQYDQFQPFLESEIEVFNQSGRQLILGLRWRRSDRFTFEWRFSEDLSSAAPDFTLGFAVIYGWTRSKETSEPAQPAEPPK